ncbi:hypothetical protein AB205_0001970 [Aquarana catesbeiana]|uniref:Uncharacterized protein n=1 Tax=Aquarana catesbeiana TaxID=8400 RepID=A0A2G9RMJ3_AQUCT|nr:hypothetical protein AB205_0001970 [Aquarana catesbeiana]
MMAAGQQAVNKDISVRSFSLVFHRGRLDEQNDVEDVPRKCPGGRDRHVVGDQQTNRRPHNLCFRRRRGLACAEGWHVTFFVLAAILSEHSLIQLYGSVLAELSNGHTPQNKCPHTDLYYKGLIRHFRPELEERIRRFHASNRQQASN